MKPRLKILAAIVAAATLSACEGLLVPVETSPSKDVQSNTVAEHVMISMMNDLELTKFQAAAVAGNLAHTTRQFTAMGRASGKGCYGFAHWCGERKNAFLSFAAEHSDKENVDANIDFLVLEMTRDYPEMLAQLKQSVTYEGATRVFLDEYLRVGESARELKKRQAYASRYAAGDFSGSACLISGEGIDSKTCAALGSTQAPATLAKTPIVAKTASDEVTEPAKTEASDETETSKVQAKPAAVEAETSADKDADQQDTTSKTVHFDGRGIFR